MRAAVAVPAIAFLSATLAAQTVSLRIQPRTGDTLHLRLDQKVEINGARAGAAPAARPPVTAELMMLTRAVVEASDESGTLVLATTDSVAVVSSDPALARGAEMARQATGRRVRLRIAGDGMASVIEGAARSEVAAFFARMPATLPRETVAIGAMWTRAMDVPLAPGTRGVPTGTLAATFRLDSLSRGGELAWISLRGALDHVRTLRADLGGSTMDIDGDMGGRLTLDRRRGWITDARIEFNLRSMLTPPVSASQAGAASPMRMRMKISQWMRVVPP